LSNEEQDWIAKYRAALDSEQGRRSLAGALIAAIRRVWQSLGLGTSSQTPDSPAHVMETERPFPKKVAHREISSAPEDRDSKAS
jgi:hypothetical protein